MRQLPQGLRVPSPYLPLFSGLDVRLVLCKSQKILVCWPPSSRLLHCQCSSGNDKLAIRLTTILSRDALRPSTGLLNYLEIPTRQCALQQEAYILKNRPSFHGPSQPILGRVLLFFFMYLVIWYPPLDDHIHPVRTISTPCSSLPV